MRSRGDNERQRRKAGRRRSSRYRTERADLSPADQGKSGLAEVTEREQFLNFKQAHESGQENKMKDSEKIEIAKRFVSLHKNDDLEDWFAKPWRYRSDNDMYLQVFNRLQDDDYGFVTELNGEYDDDGEVVKEATKFEIEISQSQTKSGHTELFWWEL